MRVSARVDGADQIRRRLAAVARSVDHGKAVRALTAGGEIIAEEARARVDVRKGDLRDSIVVGETAKYAEDDPQPHVFVGPSEEMGDRGSWEEEGTIKQAADPFLRPALETAGADALRAVGEALAGEIEGAARG